MVTYSSRDAARKLGLSPSALSKYVLAKKIPTPQFVTTGGITVYLWTAEEIEHVRQLLPKIANGRKTRYQKFRAKQKGEAQARPARRPKKKKP
jgi:predicted transcriptional regulator